MKNAALMNFSMRSFLVGIVFAFLSVSSYAEDVITIRYLDGYPPPDRSTEWINLRVSRLAPPPVIGQTSKQDIDRLFEQISAVLTENGVTKDWQLAIPDAPAIEISIDINGQKLKMTSCHTTLERSGNYLVTERGGQVVPAEDRASVLAKQSETFRRHRIAFEKILSLTLERTHARLSP
ncbi:MAG: hypothetical protein HYS46_06800 [Betaproteobacteria bacterium]|nr:hypothetical protein [Betaproteobacteria bacterium]